MDRKDFRRRSISRLVLLIVLVLILNYLGGLRFFRIDLTNEKRFTLSKTTRTILSELKDVVYIRIFLSGDLPSDLVQFKNSIREVFTDFRAYAGKNLEYEFINLYSDPNPKLVNETISKLAEKGLKVTETRIQDRQGGFTSRLIIPGAIVSYKGLELPVNLLKNNPVLPHQVNLNNSLQSLEYEFVRCIESLTSEKVEKIAFIEGHKELDHLQVQDISSEISLFFQVDRGQINGNLTNILEYKAVIIAQPLTKFNERDKFVLDQYIMRSGRVLFFLDPVQTFADSLTSGRTFTVYQDVNLYDLLFKYGIRISYNLVKDIQCNFIKVETTLDGGDKKLRFYPWVYFPLLSASPGNALTKGLNYISTEFASAIDTTPAPIEGLKRTILLATSDSSARIENPAFISMSEVAVAPDRRIFNKSRLPLAILAEGRFPSFYKNYGIPAGVTPANTEIITESKHAMIFVAGDGDMIRNDVQSTPQGNIPLALGYDKDTRQTFGNKEFIMNVINYMTDDAGLISLRSREFKLRLLDKTKIRNSKDRVKWMMVNTIFPVMLIVTFGLLFQYFRKRKYGRKTEVEEQSDEIPHCGN